MRKLFIVSGDKGGVGKSMVSIGMHYFFTDALSIDGDTRNPDFARSVGKQAICADLRSDDGWNEFMNALEGLKDGGIAVVNFPAGCGAFWEKHVGTMDEMLYDLGYEAYVLWVMNRQRDSIELLKQQHESNPVHVKFKDFAILNTYFGDPKMFSLWSESKFRKNFLKDGVEVWWPHLIDVVADKISREAISYTEALTASAGSGVMVGDKANIKSYLRKIYLDVIMKISVDGVNEESLGLISMSRDGNIMRERK